MDSFIYHVQADWDPEGGVWVTTSSDVPGLATEASTLEALTEKLRTVVPELLAVNQLLSSERSGPIHFELTSHRQVEIRQGWPESFWRAFEGMPEDFERPRQTRD